jgi:hypothetical protein
MKKFLWNFIAGKIITTKLKPASKCSVENFINGMINLKFCVLVTHYTLRLEELDVTTGPITGATNWTQCLCASAH